MSNGTAIGIVYTIMGVFGIFENGLTAYLMATDPEMRNPTYYYMINLAIADAIILVPIALYGGLLILFPPLHHHIGIRIGAFLTAVGWYPGSAFMVLASFSRFVQLATPEKIHDYFTRPKLAASMLVSWLLPSALFTCLIYGNPPPFDFFADRRTWAFQTSQKLGNALNNFTLVTNVAYAFSTNVCNIMSLKYVRKIRKEIHMFENRDSLIREIKLFAQCAITGTIYTVGVIYYFVVSAVENSMPWYGFLFTHLIWVLNHLQNPVIYFALNTRLRHRILGVFCRKKYNQVYPSPSGGDSGPSAPTAGRSGQKA